MVQLRIEARGISPKVWKTCGNNMFKLSYFDLQLMVHKNETKKVSAYNRRVPFSIRPLLTNQVIRSPPGRKSENHATEYNLQYNINYQVAGNV